MRLIDLLNDIANENTLPKKIMIFDEVFTLDEDAKDYKDEEGYWLFEDYSLVKFLNEEYKILEITVTLKQEKKKIEKFNRDNYIGVDEIMDKIDELIEAANER